MTLLKYAALGIATILAVSCEPPPPYPPVSRDFRPYGPEADRILANDRYPDTRNDDPYRSYDRPRTDPYGTQARPDPRAPRIDPNIDPGAPTVPSQPTRNDYPVAERTTRADQVLSPYAPYNVIDVEGFKTGQLAKDPSNGKIFRIP